LTVDSPGTGGNKYGFEGGRVLKLNGTYHLFTSEMIGDPHWVKMKLAHWTSRDRRRWQRAATLSGKRSGARQNNLYFGKLTWLCLNLY
jgi:hypothetical protein